MLFLPRGPREAPPAAGSTGPCLGFTCCWWEGLGGGFYCFRLHFSNPGEVGCLPNA